MNGVSFHAGERFRFDVVAVGALLAEDFPGDLCDGPGDDGNRGVGLLAAV